MNVISVVETEYGRYRFIVEIDIKDDIAKRPHRLFCSTQQDKSEESLRKAMKEIGKMMAEHL